MATEKKNKKRERDDEDAELTEVEAGTGRIRQKEIIIEPRRDRERTKRLISRGVPAQDIQPRNQRFDIVDFLVAQEPEIPGVKNKPISTKKQAINIGKLLKNPLSGPMTIGISSFPSDNRAKYVAQAIMNSALDYYEANRRSFGTKSAPLWHRVYGNFRDSLRDKQTQDNPCMLIISNLNNEASSVKIEKVRDLLEMYDNIPRIVVMGGAPPIDLFSYRLSLALNVGLYVGPNNLIKQEL